ncbi:MAG: hypothetical protein IT429_07455 [Gemmataceae bacterium]|nr:hypothetical protein [Gemmataceae bacterium]
MTRAILVVVAVFLPGTAAWGQETYTIRLKGVGEGETTAYEDTHITEMKTRQLDARGAVAGQRRDHSSRCVVYRETLLEIDPAAKQVKRLRRQCDKATQEINGKGEVLPIQGKAYRVERGPDGYRVQFEGTPPSPDFVRQLEESFRDRQDVNPLHAMLPDRPVQAGEVWSFDPRPVLQAWPRPSAVRVGVDRATGKGKLVRVYRQGERLFGVLEFRVEAPVLGVEFGSRKAEQLPGARVRLTIDVDACIDGSVSTFGLRLVDELRVQMELPGASGQRIEGTITEQHLRTETRK